MVEQQDPKHRFDPNDHLRQMKSKDGPQDYLDVKWRLVWFREQCPQGTIETEEILIDLDREVEEEVFVWNNERRRSEKIIKHGTGYARFRAVATDGKGGSATGTKTENAAAFPDFVEKAETGAIGRALAALGYGTQFAPEYDSGTESEPLVDSPVDRRPSTNSSSTSNTTTASTPPTPSTSNGNRAQREQRTAQKQEKNTEKKETSTVPSTPVPEPPATPTPAPAAIVTITRKMPIPDTAEAMMALVRIAEAMMTSEEFADIVSFSGIEIETDQWELGHYKALLTNLREQDALPALLARYQELLQHYPRPVVTALKERYPFMVGKKIEKLSCMELSLLVKDMQDALPYHELGKVLDPEFQQLKNAPYAQDCILDLYGPDCNLKLIQQYIDKVLKAGYAHAPYRNKLIEEAPYQEIKTRHYDLIKVWHEELRARKNASSQKAQKAS